MNHRADTTHDAANADDFAGPVARETPIDDGTAAELYWLVHGNARHSV